MILEYTSSTVLFMIEPHEYLCMFGCITRIFLCTGDCVCVCIHGSLMSVMLFI